MYGLPFASCSIEYTDGSSFSNLSTKNNIINVARNSYIPINNNVFKVTNCVNSSSSAKNDATSISSSRPSNIPLNSNFSCVKGSGNSSNLPAKNNVFQIANISNRNSSSNLPLNSNLKAIGCINSRGGSFTLPEKNNVSQIANVSSSNLAVNNNFKAVSCIDSINSSNIPAKNNIFQVTNINSSSGSSNLSISSANSCNSSSNLPAKSSVYEEKSSNIPATEVLEEMYKILGLDIPPVYTFRQEIITQNFFCSAGLMNKWYDTKEAFPNQEEAREAAAQSLLKVIMASEEYEKYLRAQDKKSINQQANARGLSKFLHINPAMKNKRRNKGGNTHNVCEFNQTPEKNESVMQMTEIKRFSKRKNRKRALRRRFLKQKAIEKQSAVQALFCSAPFSKQEDKPKRVKFNDKILILGEDVMPKSNNLKDMKGVVSQKDQSSSSQYNQVTQIADELETYQTLVSKSKKDCIPASKLLDELCIISNISKPKYYFCSDGYGYYIAEILVGDAKYINEHVFQYQQEAQERAAERAFNILYAKSDENTRMKVKKRISLVFSDSLSDTQVATSFILPQRCEPQSRMQVPNHNSPCMQVPTHMPAAYCNISMESASRPMLNIPTITSASGTSPFSAPNLGCVQQTHQGRTQTESESPTISLAVPQQLNEPMKQQFPCMLHKFVNERGWGIIEYQYSKTLKGYKCTCYVRKLKFTSNPCMDKESAMNQAAKIALLALPEYIDCPI